MKKTKVLALLMGALLSVSVTAGSVQPVYAIEKSVDSVFVTESSYANTMKNTVEPYIDSKKESGYLDVGQTNFKIYYEKYKVKNSKGNIVISHGFTESLEKYHEMIYYFMNEGYSVYGLEHRGHGRSGHLGKASEPSQVNVNDFEDYVSDLKCFMDKVVNPETQGKKVFLFAHSMGGGIGARFLEENNGYFDAAILSCPMLEINTGDKMTEDVALNVASQAVAAGMGDEFVEGQSAYDGKYNFAGSATTCEARYAYSYNTIKSNTEIQRRGASYRWIQKCLAGTINTRTDAAKVQIPVLLFQAGNDGFVRPGGQQTFANKAGNCKIVKVPNAKHELYMEKDEILKPYLEKVMKFYGEN